MMDSSWKEKPVNDLKNRVKRLYNKEQQCTQIVLRTIKARIIIWLAIYHLMPARNKIPFMLRIEPEIRDLIRTASRREYRSMSNYVENLILRDLGILTDEEPKEIDITFT